MNLLACCFGLVSQDSSASAKALQQHLAIAKGVKDSLAKLQVVALTEHGFMHYVLWILFWIGLYLLIGFCVMLHEVYTMSPNAYCTHCRKLHNDGIFKVECRGPGDERVQRWMCVLLWWLLVLHGPIVVGTNFVNWIQERGALRRAKTTMKKQKAIEDRWAAL